MRSQFGTANTARQMAVSFSSKQLARRSWARSIAAWGPSPVGAVYDHSIRATTTSVTLILPQLKGALPQEQISWVLTFNLVATAIATSLLPALPSDRPCKGSIDIPRFR